MHHRLLALLLACAALPALADSPAPAAPARPAGASGAKPVQQNEIQGLITQRQFEQALVRIKQLREEARRPMADPESEYWAARAEAALKQPEAARERLLAIARTYPESDRASTAMIEATTVRLNALGEGRATTPQAKKVAMDSAKELEATAAKVKEPENVSRAWFVAGNAWRIMGDDEAAARDYAKAAAVPGAKDYPGKATYTLSTNALQQFDVARAKQLLADCVKKFPESSVVEKCGKAGSRLDLIGTPAPPLDVETWVVGPPQDLQSLKGRVVILWFFATWCPHCKASMPEMAALKQRFDGKPLSMIAITNNSKDQTTEKVKAFVTDPQWGLTYPTGVDHQGATSVAFHGTGIPAAVLVDKKGIVRWADHPTYLTDAMVAKLINE